MCGCRRWSCRKNMFVDIVHDKQVPIGVCAHGEWIQWSLNYNPVAATINCWCCQSLSPCHIVQDWYNGQNKKKKKFLSVVWAWNGIKYLPNVYGVYTPIDNHIETYFNKLCSISIHFASPVWCDRLFTLRFLRAVYGNLCPIITVRWTVPLI